MAREDGFTLVELLVVLLILAILTAVAVPAVTGFRNRAADSTAKANVRSAVPAIHAYHADTGTYVGMTLAKLQPTYAKRLQNITVVRARATNYCVKSTANGRTWYKLGPTGAITTTVCT